MPESPILRERSSTIKKQIKSYLLFYFHVSNEGFGPETGLARKRETVITSADIALRGIGEPSQFRGAICSFAFLRRNVQHSAVHFARRARFCSQRWSRASSGAVCMHIAFHRATGEPSKIETKKFRIYHARPRLNYLLSWKHERKEKYFSGAFFESKPYVELTFDSSVPLRNFITHALFCFESIQSTRERSASRFFVLT